MDRVVGGALVLIAIGLAFALPSRGGAEETLERCNVAGTWRGVGLDVQRTRWQFVLTLTQTDATVAGAFDWHGSDGHDGRERVEGRVDCRARRLELHGVALEHAPALALAHYALALDRGFASFDGRWSGGIPGNLHGTR